MHALKRSKAAPDRRQLSSLLKAPSRKGLPFLFLLPLLSAKSRSTKSHFLQKTPSITFSSALFFLLDRSFTLFYTLPIKKEVLSKMESDTGLHHLVLFSSSLKKLYHSRLPLADMLRPVILYTPVELTGMIYFFPRSPMGCRCCCRMNES
jgi:hypothetical protein